MNILFFNRSFYPDIEATGQLLTELCEDLSEKHSVSVIAGLSYYVKNKNRLPLISRETYKSIEIIRAKGTILPKRIFLFRLINLGSYFFLAFWAGFLVRKKPNVIVTQTDPPVLGLFGVFFSKLYRAKFIYYCKDLYPDVGIVTGKIKNKAIILFLEKVNKFALLRADKIICIGKDMKQRIKHKIKEDKKIEVVHDWIDTNLIYPVENNPFKLKFNLNNKFLITYSGNIGFSQSLDKLIEVANELKDIKELLFLLIGEGANKLYLQKRCKKLGLLNVLFLPYQPKEELKYSLSAADVHLITLVKGLGGAIVPSKLYGILASGTPFIGWVDEESEVAYIGKKYNCGIIVPPGDIKGMVAAIKWTVNNKTKIKEMGDNARRCAVSFFDRKINTKKFEKILHTLNERVVN